MDSKLSLPRYDIIYQYHFFESMFGSKFKPNYTFVIYIYIYIWKINQEYEFCLHHKSKVFQLRSIQEEKISAHNHDGNLKKLSVSFKYCHMGIMHNEWTQGWSKFLYSRKYEVVLTKSLSYITW